MYILLVLFSALIATVSFLKFLFSKDITTLIVFVVLTLLIVYAFISSYSTISYDKHIIRVVNLTTNRTYRISELKNIRLTSNTFRLFAISFTDGREYKFVIGSPRVLNTFNLADEPANMKKTVIDYMNSSIDKQ